MISDSIIGGGHILLCLHIILIKRMEYSMTESEIITGDCAGQQIQYKVGEACIIHSISDYASANFLKEFMKWVGISFFDFVYHENDEEMNCLLEKQNNHFDFILYVNDNNQRWRKRYGHLSSANVDITLKKITKADNEVTNVLNDVWSEMFKRYDGAEEYVKSFNKLFDVYVCFNVFHKLINNKYQLSIDYTKSYDVNTLMDELGNENNEWKEVANCLEKYMSVHGKCSGLEHVIYALVYSQRKITELSGMLGEKMPYSSQSMLNTLNSIYDTNPYFYMTESLKAKVVGMNMEDLVFSLSYMKNCTELCPADACSSFHFYRLGKLFERFKRPVMAKTAYEISYKKNPLNFRALFKVIVNEINFWKYEEARMHIRQLLRILQVGEINAEEYMKRLYMLPPIELEYVCKCYILLARIQQIETGNSGGFYEKAQEVEKSVDKNEYLRAVYAEKCVKMKERLRGRLSEAVIQRKLRDIGKLND